MGHTAAAAVVSPALQPGSLALLLGKLVEVPSVVPPRLKKIIGSLPEIVGDQSVAALEKLLQDSEVVVALLLFSAWIALAVLSVLLRPVPNGCVIIYVYPTYIPIAATPKNVSSVRYGLFLYHEGWKQIDFPKHIEGLSGVPVLFIPSNGGSYKKVRSVAAESFQAYQNGPLEPIFLSGSI